MSRKKDTRVGLSPKKSKNRTVNYKMELNVVQSGLTFNLHKIVMVRRKKGGIKKGKLHRITACEVAFQGGNSIDSIRF